MADEQPDIPIENEKLLTQDIGHELVSLQIARRKMALYVATSTELHNLSFMNTVAVAFFGIGAFLLSWPISIWLDIGLTDNVTGTAKIIVSYIAWPLFLVSIGLFCIGAYSIYKAKTIIRTIKRESTD